MKKQGSSGGLSRTGRPAGASRQLLLFAVTAVTVVTLIACSLRLKTATDSSIWTHRCLSPVCSSTTATQTARNLANADYTHSTTVNAATAEPHCIYTNSDMGISEYSFPVQLPEELVHHGMSFKSSVLRVYLKLYCTSAGTAVAGFAGLFPNDPKFGSTTYFYKQPAAAQAALQLSVALRAAEAETASESAPLLWVDKQGNDTGLWPFTGQFNFRNGPAYLQLQGSAQAYQLPSISCSSGGTNSSTAPPGHTDRSAPASSRELKSSIPTLQGLWNVVTTTSPNQMALEALSRLLLLHSSYHQALGFKGTILRCNPDEAELLAELPELQLELQEGRLILWPWTLAAAENGSSISTNNSTRQPYFWQVPRNQLTLLAAKGLNVQLSFFDLDEYLVIPSGQKIQDLRCLRRPIIGGSFPAWTVPRYAALCDGCEGIEFDCWQAGLQQGALDTGNAAVQTAHNRSNRLQRLLQALDTEDRDAEVRPGQGVEINQCPCLLGKTIIVDPLNTDNTKIHKSAPAEGYSMEKSEPRCAYLVHMHALISSKRPWNSASVDRVLRNDTFVYANWTDSDAAFRALRFDNDWRNHLLTARACVKLGRDLLIRCTTH